MAVVDVGVIGAGPAGTALAIRLASLGLSVCIVERRAFPRGHIGICLAATAFPLLQTLGVSEEAAFEEAIRPRSTTVLWGKTTPNAPGMGVPQGPIVDRGRFDAALLARAVALGAIAIQPATASLHRDGDAWLVNVGSRRVRATLVADATGTGQAIAGPFSRAPVSTWALHATWNRTLEAPVIEAGRDRWYWAAPTALARSVAAVFIDRSALAGVNAAGLRTRYLGLLEDAQLLDELRGGEIVGTVRACDATMRWRSDPIGPDSIAVGDAAVRLDPLSSQGVSEAIASAIQGGYVINTLLRYPGDREAALAFYRARRAEAVQRHIRKASAMYADQAAQNDETFWRSRADYHDVPPASPRTAPLDPDRAVRLCPHAHLEPTPTITGDHIAMQLALVHPLLERPVAFVADTLIAPLLQQLPNDAVPAGLIARAWSRELSTAAAWQLVAWLWAQRILV